MITPVPEIAALSLYATPPLPASVDLRLDVTERPIPLPGDSGVYPKAAELERELAARFGVEPAQVLVTAGADEALDRICRAFLSSARVAVLTAPTFEMIRHYARLTGATHDDRGRDGEDREKRDERCPHATPSRSSSTAAASPRSTPSAVNR